MKKEYSKPQIVFESFQLSLSIAGGCNYETDKAYDVSGFNIFLKDDVCTYTPNTSNKSEADFLTEWNICYDVPIGDNNVFTS